MTNVTDEVFFQIWPDRNHHIRKPNREMKRNKQRAIVYEEECEAEFGQLGAHSKKDRWILLWRVPVDNPWYDPRKPPILKIPLIGVPGESIEDTEEYLRPLLADVMVDARKQFADE
jgi:hypothetical protein